MPRQKPRRDRSWWPPALVAQAVQRLFWSLGQIQFEKQEGDRQMAATSAKRFGRRSILAAAGAAAGSGAITGFPTIWAQNIKNVTLRQFGTGVSNLNAIADKVKQDLGFTLEMTALDTDAVTQKAVTQPKSYDIADIEYFAIKKVFPTGVMQPMDAKKIKLFDKIVPIFTNGKLTPDSTVGAGHHAVFGRASSMARTARHSPKARPNG